VTQAAFLVFARCAGFAARMPGLGHPSVPAVVRVGTALALALAIAPGVVVHDRPLPALALAVAGELAIGTAFGFGANLAAEAAYAAGRLLDDTVGIRGSVPNAAVAASTGFGRLWSSAFLAGYLLVGGYAPAIVAFADGFARIPPGAVLDAHAMRAFADAFPAAFARTTLAFAGPGIAIAVVAQIGLGAVARIVPRFGNLSLTFPVVFAAVLLVTIATLPVLVHATGGSLVLPGAR
jgi:flagellar biosynthetic protein FliR